MKKRHKSAQHYPTYCKETNYSKKDEIAWEWVMPEPAFYMSPGDQLYVMAELKVIHEAPPNYGPEPWERYMSLVTRLKDGKTGWCQTWDLEVPLL